jgi:hypothetical protein
MQHNPEFRLKSRDGQDRSVKRKNYARTTDKGLSLRGIYSLVSRNNQSGMKRELTLTGKPNVCITNYASYAALEKSLGKLNTAQVKFSLIDMEARQGDMGEGLRAA